MKKANRGDPPASMAKAEAADQADVPDGMSIPDELARREARLAKLAEARAKRPSELPVPF